MAHLISALHLENFKAFSRPTTIRLAPLTLIFGANSAGKSTILQSIYTLQQSMEHRTGPEAPPLSFGGKGAICDLGNFGEAVSFGDLRREIVLGLQLAESGLGISWRFGYLESDSIASDHELRRMSLTTAAFGEKLIDFCPGPPSTRLPRQEWAGDHDESNPLELRRGTRTWRYDSINESWIRESLQRLSLNRQEDVQRGLDGLETWSRVALRSRGTDPEFISGLLNEMRNALAHGSPDMARRSIIAAAFMQLLNSRQDFAPAGLKLLQNSMLEAWPSPRADINPVSLLRRANRRALNILEEAQCLGPMREPPRRLYPAGIGGYSALDRYLGADVAQRLHQSRVLKPEVNRWLEQLGVGYSIDSIGVPSPRNPIAVQLRLRPLSSPGGRGPSVALTDVGYGISQLLPIIVNGVALRNSLLTIEQPEVHIHPKLQAQLGDLLIHSAMREDGNQVIIETHSEHLILRLMRQVRRGRLKPSDISVIHVGSMEGEGAVVTELPLDERGRFLEAWPEGFFDERLEEMGD